MVKDKDSRPTDELGVSKSLERDGFPFSVLTRLGDRKGIRPVKSCVCFLVVTT